MDWEEIEEWSVAWFPSDRPDQRKTFTGKKAEKKARKWATKDGVAEWFPMLEHRILVVIADEIVPL